VLGNRKLYEIRFSKAQVRHGSLGIIGDAFGEKVTKRIHGESHENH